MKKLMLFFVLFSVLFSTSAFSQSKFIGWSNSWEDSDGNVGDAQVELIFDFNSMMYYKTVNLARDVTYAIVRVSGDYSQGSSFTVYVNISGGSLVYVEISSSSIVEYSYGGSWKIFHLSGRQLSD